MSDRPPAPRGQLRRTRAVVVLFLLFAAGAYVVAAGGSDAQRRAAPNSSVSAAVTDGPDPREPSEPSEPSPSPSPSPLGLEDVPGRAVANPDGSVTVTVSEREAGDLVAEALAGAPDQQLNDVVVELRTPPADADGRLVVDGRLDNPPLPVRAVVDLDVVEEQVRPTVRDLRVGPLPLSGALRDDLNRQLVELALIGEGQLTVEALATDDDELVLTGRPR